MDHLPPLIEAMLRPDFYPHPVREPVRLVQTHISYVLLTGEHVYKLKKPVNLGFLDFSSLEKRRFYCTEEVRLNSLNAPALYIGVLPIVERDGHFSFGADPDRDTVVEYAVHMREFADRDLLLNVFERGELNEDHIREIAQKLADAHAAAETNETIRAYGRAQCIAEIASENYEEIRPFIGTTETEEFFTDTHAFTDRFIAENPSLFADRIAAQKIRECHGDLHLKNICFYQGEIQFFDRIEFSDQLKNIDVIYDLAFLAMDLQYRSRGDLANVLINQYLEHTGDYEGAALLPLYLTMRACVRGKVSSMLSTDEHISSEKTAQAKEEAHNYFEHAWRYTRARKGSVIVMAGLSGSGKSTVARELAKRIDAIHIRSDVIRKHLKGVELDDHGQEIYAPETTRKTYERLAQLGQRIAAGGQNVILDATFGKRALRRRVIEESREAKRAVRILWCTAERAVLEERLRTRQGDVSDAGPDLLPQQEAEFEDFTDEEKMIVTRIDTERPIDFDALAQALQQETGSVPVRPD